MVCTHSGSLFLELYKKWTLVVRKEGQHDLTRTGVHDLLEAVKSHVSTARSDARLSVQNGHTMFRHRWQFVTERAVFFLMILLQMIQRQRHSSIVLLDGQLIEHLKERVTRTPKGVFCASSQHLDDADCTHHKEPSSVDAFHGL
ncbi:hypothetical protein TNCV_2153671 [Trichonephila clavipes]|nr:hypothetical protein TNCV_2153671 [Trichonephila clavipes]